MLAKQLANPCEHFSSPQPRNSHPGRSGLSACID
jgi:hypothetical protein